MSMQIIIIQKKNEHCLLFFPLTLLIKRSMYKKIITQMCMFFFSVHIYEENKLRHKAQSQYITDKKKHIYFFFC